MIAKIVLMNKKGGKEMKDFKINKNFEIDKLKDYIIKGLKVEYNLFTTTYGTSSIGYIYRQGLDLIQPSGKVVRAQIIFTSKGYGKITTDLREYNGRYLDHYKEYDKMIIEWLDKNIKPLIELSQR